MPGVAGPGAVPTQAGRTEGSDPQSRCLHQQLLGMAPGAAKRDSDC